MSADGSFVKIETLTIDNTVVATLADVLCHLEADAGLDARRRRELCSAVRTICRVLNADPAFVPAQPGQLRVRLKGVSPAAAGVCPGRWANIRSLTLKALKRAGIRAMAGRYREPHAPAWEVLRARLPDRHHKHGLTRFMSFCTANGILPERVYAEVFRRFREAYVNDSLLRDPGAVYRDTCKLWNQAATTVPGWPALRVEVPDRRRLFALPLDAFPASFQGDLEAYLSRTGMPDVFDESYSKPVKPLTLKRKRQNLMMVAAALVRAGFPLQAITGLDVLTAFENAKSALKFLLEREGGGTTEYLYQIATELKTVARHHVQVPEAELDRLRGICRRLKPKGEAFTEKNKRFLRQFADPNNLAALLMLPRRLARDAATHNIGPRRQATLVGFALAIAIELVIPIRVDNLAGLRLDRHMVRVGRSNKMFLTIPAEETKNGVAIEALLPPRVVELLDLYLEKFRPKLLTGPSSLLFPGEHGGRRATGGFSSQIGDCIWREIGIEITTHQFRHLAAKLYLDRHPNGYERVQQLLGHKSRATTVRFYAELDHVVAFRQYGELVAQLLAELETNVDAVDPRRPRSR